MKRTILFLDAELRSTLSMIRSIGATGEYRIITAGRNKSDISRYSKYSEEFYLYADPVTSKSLFVESLLKIIDHVQPDLILPGSDITLLPIYTSDLYDRLKEKWIAPNKYAYLCTFDKKVMGDIAINLQVKVIDEIKRTDVTSESFPLVVKPRQSRYYVEDRMLLGLRTIVHNFKELEETISTIRPYDVDPLLQKFITGKGFGITIAAKNGHIFSAFAYEQIRKCGGSSTMRRSIPISSVLYESTRKLIKEINWTGIAEVEFIGETEENAYFMEINGRPWGSIDLAVLSGIDYPKMLLDIYANKLAIGDLERKYNVTYELDHYSQWIMGELNYLRGLIESNLSLLSKWKEILSVVLKRPKKISYDTLRLSDVRPFLFELINSIRIAGGRWMRTHKG